MEQFLILLGIVLIFTGMIIIIIGSLLGAQRGEVKVGIGGFIGPIPFGFASERGMLYLVIVLTIAMFVVFVLVSHRFL